MGNLIVCFEYCQSNCKIRFVFVNIWLNTNVNNIWKYKENGFFFCRSSFMRNNFNDLNYPFRENYRNKNKMQKMAE